MKIFLLIFCFIFFIGNLYADPFEAFKDLAEDLQTGLDQTNQPDNLKKESQPQEQNKNLGVDKNIFNLLTKGQKEGPRMAAIDNCNGKDTRVAFSFQNKSACEAVSWANAGYTGGRCRNPSHQFSKYDQVVDAEGKLNPFYSEVTYLQEEVINGKKLVRMKWEAFAAQGNDSWKYEATLKIDKDKLTYFSAIEDGKVILDEKSAPVDRWNCMSNSDEFKQALANSPAAIAKKEKEKEIAQISSTRSKRGKWDYHFTDASKYQSDDEREACRQGNKSKCMYKTCIPVMFSETAFSCEDNIKLYFSGKGDGAFLEIIEKYLGTYTSAGFLKYQKAFGEKYTLIHEPTAEQKEQFIMEDHDLSYFYKNTKNKSEPLYLRLYTDKDPVSGYIFLKADYYEETMFERTFLPKWKEEKEKFKDI